MNFKEYAKNIQKLYNDFKNLTGENLNIVIDENTGYLSSQVYSGSDYPKDRQRLLSFLHSKIVKYYMKNKIIFIDPFVNNNYICNSFVYFKLANNHELADDYIYCFDLLEWYKFPKDILNFYINYLKGAKDFTISVWEEQDGPYTFKIYNDKTYLCVTDEINEDDFILYGTPREQAKEILLHFKKFSNEWENGILRGWEEIPEENLNKKCPYLEKGEIVKLCEELESLLNEKTVE